MNAPKQSSWRTWYRLHVGDKIKYWRRQIRRTLRSPLTALRFHHFKQAVKRRDWKEAKPLLAPLATAAERHRDQQLLKEITFSARQLGEYENATRWELATARLENSIKPTDWQGEDLGDATLVVRFMETRKQGLAGGLNLTGYLRKAAGSARECHLVVEKRMVPIYARSFPEITVHEYPAEIFAAPGTRMVTANPLSLKVAQGTAPEQIEKLFEKLTADLNTATALRHEYQAGGSRPLIGISWWSSHYGKESPPIEQWAELLRSTDATFVSVQYGEVTADLNVLGNAAPGRLIVDPTVDQLVDMDRFASQLAALDGLITISNTGAHLAGSLGVRTWLLRDDRFRRAWPVLSDRIPWYPNTRVMGKNGRPWEEVLREIRIELAALETATSPAGDA